MRNSRRFGAHTAGSNQTPQGDAPKGGVDRVSRFLLIAVVVLIVTILTAVIGLVLQVQNQTQGPRTALERRLLLAESAVKANPDSYGALAELASAQIDADKLADAAETVEKIIEMEPDRVLALALKGDLAAARGDDVEALKLYDAALEYADVVPATVKAATEKSGIALKQPYYQAESNTVAFVAAELAVRLGRFDDAERLARLAIKTDEQDAAAHALLGDILAKRGDSKGAEAEYNAALKFVPDYQPALSGLERLGLDAEGD